MSAVGNTLFLEPLGPARNRTTEVSERIAAEIASGRLGPGARLPTEQELVAVMKVSRSVVREAVASLRADGLVITRQGAGAFVASDEARVPFRIDPSAVKSVADVINIMELRLATEVEAAAFAAERATGSQRQSVKSALRAIDDAIGRGESAVREDFAFHRAIAIASGNPIFDAFLVFLGRHVIPRQHQRAESTPEAERAAYLAKIQQEHEAIAEAIGSRNPKAARNAMRRHLSNSLARQQRLARQLSEERSVRPRKSR